MTRAPVDLQSDANNRQRPNYRQHRPSPWTTQHAQGEWRVRAGNQQKDCGVIEDAKDLLRCFVRYRVIKRRREIEQHHRSAKHAHAHEEANIAGLDRRQHKNRQRHQREQQPQTVTDTVGDLFAK